MVASAGNLSCKDVALLSAHPSQSSRESIFLYYLKKKVTFGANLRFVHDQIILSKRSLSQN